MLTRLGLALSFVLAFALRVSAQDDDNEAIKKAILEKVRAKLAEERKKTLERVAKIIDEELAKDEKKPDKKNETKPDAKLPAEYEKKIKELEKQLKVLDEKREELAIEIRKTKNLALDEEIRKEAKDNGPKDEQEAQQLFDEALQNHNDKDFKSSIRKFKILYYAFPKTQFGNTSAYNVACGYALAGDKELALDWLELCVGAGWSNWDHMRQDTDLDTLRNEKRYKKILADK